MSTIIASLMAVISADISGLKKGLDTTKSQLGEMGKKFEAATGITAKAALQMVGYTTAAGLAYKATGKVIDILKDSVTETMDYAKAVEDVSRFTGASVQESSKLLQITDDLRIPIESLKMGMKSAVREGVMPTIQGLKDLAKEYQNLPTDLQKSQFALEKFGRAGMEMQKFLELTPGQIDEMTQSAEEFGLVLNSQSIKSAHEFYLQLDDLNDQWAGIKMGIGQDAIPALSQLLTTLESLEKIGERGGPRNLAKDWWELFLALSYGVKPIEDANRELEDLYNGSKDAGLIISGVTQSFEDYALWGNKIFTASSDMSEGVGGLTAEFIRMKTAAEGVNESLEGMKFDFILDGLEGFGDGIVQQTALLLTYKRIMGEISEATYQSSIAKLDELRALERMNEGIEDGTVTQGEYFGALKDGVITLEEVNDAVGYTTGNMTDLAKQTGMTEEQWAESTTNMASSVGAVTGAIEGVTGAAGVAAGAIDGIGASISALPTHTTLTIDIIYNQQGRPVGIGGEGEFGERGGNVYKAAGGPVAMGNAYIVGENGPEWFVPNTSGRIIPNSGGRGGGDIGGDTYIINNNSTGAAALTMAIIAQAHRARLGRSMGV